MAGKQGYKNGAADGAAIGAGSVSPVTLMEIGRAYNGAGTGNRSLGWTIQAVAIYNTTLSDPQVAAVSAAMAAL